MRRFAIIVSVLLAASAAVLNGTPAAAAGESYSVESQISLGIVDVEGLFEEDEHCGFGGRTSQELVQSSTPTQLGTGQPEVSYRWNQGPFRDHLGRAVTFFCGDEVSVCFHPARVTVSANGAMTITMQVKLFEGDGDPFYSPLPCYPADQIDAESVTLAVPAGTRKCLGQNVKLGDPEGDRLTIGSFCASATRLAGPPPQPAPVQPIITGLHCDSIAARFTCDLSYTDGSGTAVTIRWHINGTPVAALNDRRSINRGCTVDDMVAVRVVVANATGGSAQRTTSVLCLDTAN